VKSKSVYQNIKLWANDDGCNNHHVKIMLKDQKDFWGPDLYIGIGGF
jgi:hypothetical protein